MILIQSQIAVSVIYFYRDMTCAGAKAAGMGGAFIGVADEATAIIWNPAGLINIARPEILIISASNSSKSQFPGWENEQSHFSFDFISVAYPIKEDKLVVSVAYQKPFDYYMDYVDEDDTINSTGSGNSFSIGAAYRILPYFSTGLSVNTWFGKINFEEHNYEHEYTYQWYNYESIYDCEQTLSGFNVILGGFIDLKYLDNPFPLRFGITYRSAFDLKAKQKGVFSEYLLWESGEDVYFEQSIDGSRKNKIPKMFGIGASYNYDDNLKIAADFEIRAYSDSNINQHNDDLMQFRIGAEYLFETSFTSIPIRIGYFTDPKLLADAKSNQVIGSGFSLGTGLIFNKFNINIAYARSANENYRGYYGTQDTANSKLVFSGNFYF